MNDLEKLLEIMAALRDPENGCPWDLEQDFRSIAPYTLEEAYEVVDAIERDDPAELQAELGDLLFQVVFYAQMAREAGDWLLHSSGYPSCPEASPGKPDRGVAPNPAVVRTCHRSCGSIDNAIFADPTLDDF